MQSSLPIADATDATLLAERVAKRDRCKGPRVGDYVIMITGETRRFTHKYPDALQTTVEGDKYGASFYLGSFGRVEFSGGLDKAIPMRLLQDTGETKPGAFWMFHHDFHRAHNGVTIETPCRVYKMIEETHPMIDLKAEGVQFPTPWGTADFKIEYAPGVILYTTPSHGGFKLDGERNAKIGAAWKAATWERRGENGWYEEDVDWSMVALTFSDLFKPEEVERARGIFAFFIQKKLEG